MTDISFTSAITPVPLKLFNQKSSLLDKKSFVDFPWTIDESVKSMSAATKNVCDCSILGITDGTNVFLMHLSPENDLNHISYFIRQCIARNVDLKSDNLQGILIGSKPTKKSQDLYNKLAAFLTEFRIPFSELKNAKDAVNVFYSSVTDGWLIASVSIDRFLKKGKSCEEIIKNTFKEVRISDLDYMG